jgi:hypothetical protein
MRLAFLALIVVMTAFALVGCGSKCGDIPSTVATVNGKSIDCTSYVNTLNARAGRDALGSMIEQQVVLQWADKAGVAPTDSQIQRQADALKDAGQYDDQLEALGEAGLKAELTSAQARINLSRKYVKTDDKEVEQAYEFMKPRFVHGPRKFVAAIISAKKSKIEDAEKAIKDGKDFDEVARKYGEAPSPPQSPPLKAWVDLEATQQPELTKEVKATKEGETSGIITLKDRSGQESFVIVKVLRKGGAANKSLKDAREEVMDAIAYQKSVRDPDFAGKLSAKLKAAKIEVNIKQYKGLVEQIKNQPPPGAMPPPGQ